MGWNARHGCATVAAIVVVASAAAGAAGGDEAAIAAALQRELDAWRAEVRAPGAVAAIARREGAVITAASGLARKEPATPMAVDARMFSGSIGKVIVATVALQLVEEGALELDAPLAQWLGDEPWYAQLPNGDAITLRQLMNHTSGLPEYFSDPGALAKLKSDPQHDWTPEERLSYVLGKPARFEAGRGWGYADTNYIVLGMVLERAGGGDFYDLARERLLEPLALGSTTPAVQSANPGLCSGYTQPNRPFPFPAEVAVDGVYCANPQFEWTGGGYVTTPGDLARLAVAVFGSEDLLSNARRAEQTHGVAAQLTPGEQYGLGCTLRDATNGGATGRAIGHSGWFPGYLSDMAWFEGAGVAVAVQINTDQGVGVARLHQFLDRAALAVAPWISEVKEEQAPADAAGGDEEVNAGETEVRGGPAYAPAEPREPDGWPPATTAAEAGVDPKLLAELLAKSRESRSDALVVVVDGKLVAEEYSADGPGPIEVMSCTKSVVGLLVGLLVDDGKIESVDTPVSHWFPEFLDAAGGDRDPAVRARRALVTLRHLMTHTSGLVPDPGEGKVGAADDIVRSAIEARLIRPPGTAFDYSNLALNLVVGIVERVSGMKAHELARTRLFEPLGIVDWVWRHDEVGTAWGMSGCLLTGRDMARLGQLLLQRGTWQEKRIISEAWLDQALSPSHPELKRGDSYGLLWWLDVQKSETTGRSRVRGFRAEGMLGNRLLVVPDKKLVAVRLRRYPADPADRAKRAYAFAEFTALARHLVPDK